MKLYHLLILTTCLTSCNGQVKTSSPIDSIKESKEIPGRQLKISMPQGIHKEDNIHCGLQDKAGNLWFGTTGEGVYRYDGKFFTNFTEKDSLSNNTVWSILEDASGNIWFGTGDGICRYDGKTFRRVPMVIPIGNYLYPYTSTNNNPYIKNEVWSILQDKKGKLWFGTSNGVYQYDGKSFTHFLHNDSVINTSGLRLKMVQCMLEDKNGIIWFGSGLGEKEGLCRFDGISINSFKPNGDVWIRSIFEDKKGNIWTGGRHNGISVYDGKTFTNFTEKDWLTHDLHSVTAFMEDKMGNIWFSVEYDNGGLWCFDGKFFKNFTTKDGLINNSVWCIVEDKAGNLWIGSRNNGLCRYDGKTFTSYTEDKSK